MKSAVEAETQTLFEKFRLDMKGDASEYVDLGYMEKHKAAALQQAN
jgi:hypothetical protein